FRFGHFRISKISATAEDFYRRRARRNELTAKNMNIAATAMATAISQCATSWFQERSAEFSQAKASTAKIAPITSWKSCRTTRHKRWKPRGSVRRAGVVIIDMNRV